MVHGEVTQDRKGGYVYAHPTKIDVAPKALEVKRDWETRSMERGGVALTDSYKAYLHLALDTQVPFSSPIRMLQYSVRLSDNLFINAYVC